jgi:sialic acid synthase SpsE
MKIGNHDTDEKVFVIAEIGNNHEGDFDVAAKLVTEAAGAGANAVKFQTFITEQFLLPDPADRFERYQSYELTQTEFRRLKELADELEIVFISTPLDLESASFLNELVAAFKVASSDNNWFPLLRNLAGSGKPLIVSTGLSHLDKVSVAVEYIEKQWQSMGHAGELALLHCVTQYPVDPSDVHLAAMDVLQASFPHTVGYSDHTLGIDASVFAVARGARIIEKHFTLDKNFSDFRDHQLSADPAEMAVLIQRIREVEELIGTRQKVVLESEMELETLVTRSATFKNAVPAGHVLSEKDVCWTRPGTGIRSDEESGLYGRVVRKPMSKGAQIQWDDLT